MEQLTYVLMLLISVMQDPNIATSTKSLIINDVKTVISRDLGLVQMKADVKPLPIGTTTKPVETKEVIKKETTVNKEENKPVETPKKEEVKEKAKENVIDPKHIKTITEA